MWSQIVDKTKRVVRTNNFIFLVVSIVFAVIIAGARMGGDDAAVWEGTGLTPRSWFDWVYGTYYSWTSRVIINYVWIAVLHSGKFVWMAYMGASVFVMLKAFELLFFKDKGRENLAYIICIALLFPFSYITTAGWIATSTTYFGPLAFGLICLVPIRYAMETKKVKVMPFIFYCISLIYAANEEQMVIIILAAYLVATVYLSIKKKLNWQIIVLFVLSVLSLLFIVTCPGNQNRGIAEEGTWFPTYEMLDFVDKAEIGLSTTMKWLIIDNNVFLIFTLVIMAWFVWKKYDDIVIRFISIIPPVVVLSFGLFSDIVNKIFPYTNYINRDVDYYGAFTVANNGSGVGAIQFAFFLMILFIIIAEVILLNNKIEGFVADITLIAAGLASRVGMGFSPTIYASGPRTFTPLIICIMAVSVHLWCENKDVICNDIKSLNIVKCLMGLLSMYGVAMLMCVVYSTFNV